MAPTPGEGELSHSPHFQPPSTSYVSVAEPYFDGIGGRRESDPRDQVDYRQTFRHTFVRQIHLWDSSFHFPSPSLPWMMVATAINRLATFSRRISLNIQPRPKRKHSQVDREIFETVQDSGDSNGS
jgi:hypothetical protein